MFYLKKILAKFSPEHMTSHPILTDKATTNTLKPPFSYLEQKKETNDQSADTLELSKNVVAKSRQ